MGVQFPGNKRYVTLEWPLNFTTLDNNNDILMASTLETFSNEVTVATATSQVYARQEQELYLTPPKRHSNIIQVWCFDFNGNQ